ncbi:4-aminobutyrate--2-oxoglutarate transaminase [Kiloniella antarctica]|uniref:4-aminobutyrate--2-oxoglutarate transaminase n=1 Tax=Kiloniella antarctica TaxID=1550907 RepID=A0ABW5BIK9_9PROT
MDNSSLSARRDNAIPRGVATATNVFADRAENAELWDVEGRRYIDFAGGIAVLNTGHRHPTVMARVQEQMERFTHTAYQVVPYESYVELAERLNKIAPGPTPKKTLFLTTGAEAVENAIKIARAHTGRPGVIAFSGGFHGRTNLTMGLTGKVVPYKVGFGPFPADIFHVPYPMANHGISEEDSLDALNTVFKADVDPNRIAAIIIEPVQGEGGFYIASPAFMQKLRAICDQHGILLIADEIQTGFARTGRTLAIEHAGIEPDMITVAKSLAGGFPLSGVIGKADIMDAPAPGGLGGTYGGSPIGCAAALAVLDVIETEKLNEKAIALGERTVARLSELSQRANEPVIGDIRNLGGMIAFELMKGDAPDPVLAKALCVKAMENGLILLSCGIYGNTIRILVPLTAENALIDEGMDVLEATLAQCLVDAQ